MNALSLTAAHQEWLNGASIDFMVPRKDTWLQDPFRKTGARGTIVEFGAMMEGTKFRVRPKKSRVIEIAAEIFGPHPAEVNPEWRSVRVAHRAVDEALTRMRDLFLSGYNPHSNLVIDCKNIERKVREEFLGEDWK